VEVDMRKTRVDVRFSPDELTAIDEARKSTKESRSSYIRRALFSSPDDNAVIAPKSDEMRLRIANLERHIMSIKNVELKTIATNQRLINTFNIKMFTWLIKYILNALNVKMISAKDKDVLGGEYELPGRKDKVAYPEYYYERIKEKLKEE